MGFFDDLRDRIEATGNVVLVGLDVDIDRLPDHLLDKGLPRRAFNRRIIDATYEHATAFKPSVAFYEDEDGWCSLREAIVYAHGKGVPVLLDAKYADIGSTIRKYVDLLDDADTITVSPYMGRDPVQPFLSREDKGVLILYHTSNPDGADLQLLELDTDESLYERAAAFYDLWSGRGNVDLVVGATGPDKLECLCEQAPNLPFLVPGVGAQGGDAEATVEFDLADGVGLVNSLRGIILVGEDGGEGSDKATGRTARHLKNRLNQYH